MISRARRFFKDFMVYGVGDAMAKATGLITLPIYTRILTLNEYGVWNLLISITAMLGGILILGGNSAYSRYYFEAKTHEEKKVLTSTWLIFTAIWCFMIIGCCLPFAKLFSSWTLGTERYGNLFMLALFSIPITLINLSCGQVLRNGFQAKLFSLLNIISTVLTVSLSMYAVITLHLGVTGVIGGTLAGLILMLPVRIWTIRKSAGFSFSLPMLRNLLSYGTPLIPVSVAYWIFVSSDRIILGRLSNQAQLGLYAVANNLANALILISSSLGQAWSPHAVDVYENHRTEAPRFFGSALIYIIAGFGMLSVFLTAFSKEILSVLSTPSFYPAALAVGPLALGGVALASTQITATGISITKKTYYLAIIAWIAAGLNVGLNILWVPKWGMMASSWATAISYSFLTLGYFLISQQLWAISYARGKMWVLITLTLGFTLGVVYLPPMNLAMALLVKILYGSAFVSLLFLLNIFNRRTFKSLYAADRPDLS